MPKPAEHTRPRRRILRSAPGLILLAAAALFVGSLVMAFTLHDDARKAWLAESGPIETASIALHLAGAAILILSALLLPDRGFATRSALFLALFAAREADFHNRFTTEGIFRTSYFLKSGAPLAEKAAVAALLVFIAFVAIGYLPAYAKRYTSGLRQGTAWVYAALLGLAFLVAGKSLDASTGLLRSIGSSYEPPIQTVNLFEESTECVGAAMLFAATLLYAAWNAKQRRAQESTR